MPIMFWNPTLAEEPIMRNAAARLELAAKEMAKELKANTPEGTVSRPMYTRGANAGKWWTARDAGALKGSVRVTMQGDGRYRNAWIMCGNKKAYYGKIVEFGANGNDSHKGFFRKSINRAKPKAKRILMGGGS